MRHTIDGAAFRRMVISAAASIEMNKDTINELNVFPVPDGDTGTNMSMTLNTAAADLRRLDETTALGKVASTTASALLRGARGNSGVILSLLFRGMSKALKQADECGGKLLAIAMKDGVEAAYNAVMKPAEGTILTVARLAAAAAVVAAEKEDSFELTLQAAIEAGKVALANTVNQNPVLKKAGVVDAGGMGWMHVLEGMMASLRCKDIVAPEEAAQTRQAADFAAFDTGDITFGYCTEFIVSRENDLSPNDLRDFLCGMGDSLVLVDDDEIIKVHVHTNHPGVVLEKALEYGGFVTVKVENMRLQHTEKIMDEKDAAPKEAAPEKKYGIVSVCAGEGLASVFRDLGADSIVSGGQTMNPSTEDILAQIARTPAEIVYVFPNNKNIIMAAEQAIPLTEKKVIVIPSKTIPQGIAALLCFDPEAAEEELTAAMIEALAGVSTMQITYAARDSNFDGYAINAGDYLALSEGSLFGSNQDVATLLTALAQKVADDGKEFVTIYTGADTTQALGEQAEAIFREHCPEADINLVPGGQPVYYFIISAE